MLVPGERDGFVNVGLSDRGWSWPFHAGLFLLACVKVAGSVLGLKIGLGLRTFGFFVLQLAVIYVACQCSSPSCRSMAWFRRVMYGLWWLVGLLPPFYVWLTPLRTAGGEAVPVTLPAERWDVVQNVIRRTYVIAPWILMVMHVSFSHWAHHSDFQLADVAPVLLGLALASTRVHLATGWRVITRFMPLAALFCALADGNVIRWIVDLTGSPVTVFPLHFAVAAVVVVYGFMISPFHGKLWPARSCLSGDWDFYFSGHGSVRVG